MSSEVADLCSKAALQKPSRRSRWLAAGTLVLCAVAALAYWKLRHDRSEVRQMLNRGRWSQARHKLDWLLRLSPHDSELRMMMAEAYALDDTGSGARHAQKAVEFLREIPDAAPEGVAARIHEARLRLLLLRQPLEAEKLLQRAIRQNPSASEAYALWWRVLDLTGREELAEPVFRKLYELTDANSRVNCLRDWFYSQVSPQYITATLDDQMGFRQSPQETIRQVELTRLLAFRQNESDQPVTHAAVARWFQQEGDPEQALRVLRDGEQALHDQGSSDVFFLSTMISVMIELGRLEQAADLLERWPAPRSGHEYWKLAGMLQEELHRDYSAAIEAYEKALTIWPGPTDWRTRFRQATCMGLTGDSKGADAARKDADRIQQLFHMKAQERLRAALQAPEQAENRQEIIEYYRALGRDEEVRFWKNLPPE